MCTGFTLYPYCDPAVLFISWAYVIANNSNQSLSSNITVEIVSGG